MAYVNTQPEVVTYSGNGSDLQAAIDAAITAGKSLYIAAGTYDVTNVGIGGPIRIFGTPGKVIIRPTAGSAYAFYFGAFGEATMEGLIFDGAGRSLVVDGGLPYQAMVAAKRAQAPNSRLRVRDCTFRNSPHAGIQLFAIAAEIEGCSFEALGGGIACRDNYGVRITGNDFTSIVGNAVYLDRTTLGQDGTMIAKNRITTVTQGDPSSTGWEGNGILANSATNVQIADNWLNGCAYSSIRANYCSGVQIVGNTCLAGGETAIYVEAAGIDQLTAGHGAVVVGNLVDDTATGISVCNYDHNGRLAVIGDNLVRNAVVKTVNVGAPNQSTTGGCGIIVEADCNVSGNVVENAARFGVVLGTNDYTDDLLCNDNLIRNAPIGIGFANATATGGRDTQIFIASNMVAHFTDDVSHGAIVPIGYNSSGYYRGTGADLGQVDTSTTYPNVRVDRNRCF